MELKMQDSFKADHTVSVNQDDKLKLPNDMQINCKEYPSINHDKQLESPNLEGESPFFVAN